MSKNEIISVFCFGAEIGRLGFDENLLKSSFQYNPDFLKSNKFLQLFPQTGILKRVPQTQVFSQFNNETFKGIPPMIADSLPDYFGNVVFNKWLESTNKVHSKISVLEQLAYVANRGMGALEYKPIKHIPNTSTINFVDIINVLNDVLNDKQAVKSIGLNNKSLLNVFKIGTSAGGARPKILISENKSTGEIIAGDLNYSLEFNHYLVKLCLEEAPEFNRELIEYCYYQTALNLGITMMYSKIIEDKHFATLRFDRQNGAKKHVLTATGLTGWDFLNPNVSSYENLFELATFLKLPHTEINELFKRMVFNLIFCNTDDHLKNHSFIYNEITDSWNLSPAYDLTYSLNPLINYKRINRALSINNKRNDITIKDVMKIAEIYSIKNPKGIILETQNNIPFWKKKASEANIPIKIIESISKDFLVLI